MVSDNALATGQWPPITHPARSLLTAETFCVCLSCKGSSCVWDSGLSENFWQVIWAMIQDSSIFSYSTGHEPLAETFFPISPTS